MAQPLRSTDIGEANEKIVLKLLHGRGILSQSEAVDLTGLRAPTVLRIFGTLADRGYIRPAVDPQLDRERERERKGRRPVYYELVPQAAYTMGADLSPFGVAVSTLDFTGEVVTRNVAAFKRPMSVEDTVDALITSAENDLRNAGINRESILGLGVGVPGIVDIREGRVIRYARFPDMEDFPLRDRLEEALGVPVMVHNNASTVALGECRYGVARDYDEVVAVLIRAGVGGSFIRGGEIFLTRQRTTLEVGHMILETDGRICGCGGQGCLEAYVSEEALEAALGPEYFSNNLSGLDEAVDRRDPAVIAVLENASRYLSLALRNLYQILDPRAFLVISRSRRLSDFLAASAQKVLSEDPLVVSHGPPAVLPAVFDRDRAVRGAADLVMDAYFSTR